MTYYLFIFLLVVICHTFSSVCGNYAKGFDDSILFRINWPGNGFKNFEESKVEKIIMTSSNNEKYQCLIPLDYESYVDASSTYSGPSALHLLYEFFSKQTCSLRIESYWTYEVCHGLHVKQYHERRDSKGTKIHEFVLGWYTPLEEDKDNTGKPRLTRVLYVCIQEGRNEIYSIKEIYSCEYEIVILTNVICGHPNYRPKHASITDLNCIPLENEATKPRNLIHTEAESLRMRTRGSILTGDISSGSVKVEAMDDTVDELPDELFIDVVPKTSEFPLHPGVDHKLIEDFLNGDYCLHGGAGWWKYEFCYGQKVSQYHEEKDSKVMILLGSFDISKHKEWLLQNPNKKFKPERQQVSHFYSGGTICDINDNPRQVEVKMKCKEGASASSVTLYLLEPKVCEYVLGVETSIICPLLPHADELGLFTLQQANKIAATESKKEPEDN